MAGQEQQIMQLLEGRPFGEYAKALDAAELSSPSANVLEAWPAALHLLGHIYNGDLADARMLWKRLPNTIKAGDAELEAVWKLLQYAWAGQYAGVWQALQGFTWSLPLQPIVGSLVHKTRAQALELISSGYSSMRPDTAAQLTGLSEADAVALFASEGWPLEAASGTMQVSRRKGPDDVRHGHANLQQLAEYMVHLEHA